MSSSRWPSVHANDVSSGYREETVTEEDVSRVLVIMQPLEALCIEKRFSHALLVSIAT